MAFAQLIPGLPNDLAIQCLLCLPYTELHRAEKVNSLWKIAITSDRFYVERRRRAPFPSIYVIHRIHNGYEILDADSGQFTKPRLLFSCDLQTGQMLFPVGVVFASVGTSIFAFAPGRQVQKFSLLSRKWTLVNKTMPSECKLFVAAVDKHVVVLACKRFDDDDDDDGDPDGYGHDVGDGVSMCEVFDSQNNQWASLEGLPDGFAGTHCITCQGIVYVRGKADALPVSVYALDLSKKRWEEDAHMRDRLQYVLHKSKVIARSDALLMAWQQHSTGAVRFQLQQAGAFNWMDVVRVNTRPTGGFFVLEQGVEIFLAVLDAGQSWRSRCSFYFNGLKTLHIPSDKLLMVGSISG